MCRINGVCKSIDVDKGESLPVCLGSVLVYGGSGEVVGKESFSALCISRFQVLRVCGVF